jgi:hypothetical protein
LIFKAYSATTGIYQQSYPQEHWTIVKRPLNQALSCPCEGEMKKIADK